MTVKTPPSEEIIKPKVTTPPSEEIRPPYEPKREEPPRPPTPPSEVIIEPPPLPTPPSEVIIEPIEPLPTVPIWELAPGFTALRKERSDILENIAGQMVALGWSPEKIGEKLEVWILKWAIEDAGLIPVGEDEYIRRGDFLNLSEEDQEYLKEHGFEEFKEHKDKEYEDRLKEWGRDKVVIGDQGIPIEDWEKIPEKYQSIAINEGFDAMGEAIEADRIRGEKTIADLAGIDNNLALALKRKLASTDDLLNAGFDREDIDKATEAVEASEATGIAVAGDRIWYDIHTRKTYTDVERRELLAESPQKRDDLVLSPESGRRLGIELVAFVAPATKAALPEYEVEDISAVEWGLTGVNAVLLATAFAPGVILGSLTGKAIVTGLSTTGAGLIGYETKKHWADLSPIQRAIGVGGTLLYALPIMVTAGRGIKISSAQPIPTVRGEIPTWKGLSIAQHPVIGRSGGKWVVGARNITLPEARLILDGYKPEMMLETKVFLDAKSLKMAGLSDAQVDYLVLTLKDRNLFAGKKSPFLAKDVLLEPTQRLDIDEIDVLMRLINKYNKKIKQVDMLYGSSTIKPQLAPELRGWRQVHDWDISTTMSLDETSAFAKELLEELVKIGKGRQYRINPKSPMLVEKRIGGRWEHIADIHSHETPVGFMGSEIPSSKLDVTGEYSYGRMVAEPAITVKYPGVGKIDIMTLSESGVRKTDTILRVRQTPEGVAFRPPQRGIAQPGVPKDAADFYVILRTFKGEKIAEEWLESWAKAMGYTSKELARVLPRIRKAILEISGETPSSLIGYRFYPAIKTTVSPGVSPSIIVHIPSSLGASVSGSLARRISTPTSPYAISPSIRASLSTTVSSLVSPPPKISPKISPIVVPSLKTISYPPIIPPSIPPSMLPPSIPPSVPPSVPPSPKPSPAPSPVPSPAPSPTPVPSPVPYPTPKPKPWPEPSPKPKPKPKPWPKPRRKTKEEEEEYPPGTVCFVQGRPYGGAMYKVLPPPYRQEDFFTVREPPPGYTDEGWEGEGSAQKSLQIIGEALAENVENIDLGWARININVEGGIPKIEYIQDVEANVGLRHKTVGMGEGQIPIDVWKEAKEQGIPYEDFVRDYKGELVGEGALLETPESFEREEREIEEVGEPIEEKVEPIEVEQEASVETPEPLEAEKVSPLDIPMLFEQEESKTEEAEELEGEGIASPVELPEALKPPELLEKPKPLGLGEQEVEEVGGERIVSPLEIPMLLEQETFGAKEGEEPEGEEQEPPVETLEPLEMELGSPLDIVDPFEQEASETEEVSETEQTSEPTIVMVDSWRDIPVLDADSNLKAYHDPATNTIYAIKGVTTRAEMEHEIYHSLKGHKDVPQDPVVFVRHELEAHKYAYDKLGEPKNLLMKYRGILNDLIKNTYNVKPHEAMQIMESELEKVSPPQEWKRDFAKLTDEVEQMYGKAEEEPETLESESFPMGNSRHPKKPKNMKDWWESDFYSNEPEQRAAVMPERRYFNHRLLPPDLGGSL